MKSILVADDDEFILDLVQAALAAAGYQVTTVSGGRDALARLATDSYDLVILDVMMPDQGGIETIIEIRRTNPEQPIVVMTGQIPTTSGTLESLTQKLGAKSLLAKPFTTDQLVEVVRQQIGS
jgi:two-component system, chemotaxis family, chemotaxis protein CheY